MIKIYTTPTCPYCQMAKEYFRSHGIEYEEIDVAQDRQKAMEMVHKSGQMGVPVIEIDGQIIVGFDQNAMDQALQKV